MDSFYSFDITGEPKNYFYSGNHFFMLLVSLVLIIFFTMLYERKSRRRQRIFVGVVTALLFLLEIARLCWRYYFLKANSMEITFISLTGIDFFQLCLYISLPLLILAVVCMKKKDYTFGLSFIFAMGALSGIISLIYPVGVNVYHEFYHAYNLIYMLERIGLITCGFILAISRNISATEFLDLWGGLLSIATFGAFAVGLNFILGWENNLFYVSSCLIFEELGVYLPFPLHLIMLGIFLFLFQLVMYLPFRLYEKWRNKAIMEGRYHGHGGN